MFRKFRTAIAARFDERDAILVVGLGLLAAGLSYISTAAAFAAPGTILIYVAIFVSHPRSIVLAEDAIDEAD